MFLIGVMVVKDLKEEDKLRDDISSINELINSDNPDDKLINKKLKTYVTTGDNLSLEKAVKRYYLDSYDLVKKYNNIVNVEKISNLVSINNFMFDGKDFNISKNYINDINNNLDEVVNEVSEQLSDKNRNKYFKKYKLDSYYKDLYNELTLSFDYFGSEKSFRKNVNELKKLVSLISDTLNYLSDNKSHWLISNDTIIFDSNEKLSEFGILLSKIEDNNEYINQKERFGHWKDTGLMFKGPGVENLTLMFLEMWNAFEEKEGTYHDYVPEKYEESGGEDDGYILSFSDSPLDDENTSENVYTDILYSASSYVYITTPYLAVDSSLQNALCLAAKRGVDVRLITPGIPDKKMVYRLTRSYYASLIRAGVKIYEYTPGFIHAKSYVSDDKLGVVGTINMDYRSLYLHFECGTLFYDSPAVIDLRNDDLATIEKCRKIELADCHTSFFGELLDRILRVIAPLL